ncbi:MAG: branched-chain amino acid ABC transporter permease [Betaproteobacteria bacterium]|nr:branched-chain amino acid ABC transporter permease [Betaproteobacteria bacterium]
MSSIILQQLLNGLLDGIYYLLIALGLSLIFSLGGIVNLAHGAFYAIGAYLTTLIAPQLGYGGALILSPITVAILGIFLERYFFRRFYRSDPILSLLLTFGLAMVCEQSLRMIFGAAPLSFGIPDGLRVLINANSKWYNLSAYGNLNEISTTLLWKIKEVTDQWEKQNSQTITIGKDVGKGKPQVKGPFNLGQ